MCIVAYCCRSDYYAQRIIIVREGLQSLRLLCAKDIIVSEDKEKLSNLPNLLH